MQVEVPIPIKDYEFVLKALPGAVGEMVAAFNRDEYTAGHETAEKIAAWYFPESDYYAERIAELIKRVFADAYFGSAQDQVRKHRIARERERENSFEPPF